MNAVYKRCYTTERPIACLLSGGVDSSLVASLVNKYHDMHNMPKIETYSIGMEGSEDLKYANECAKFFLNSGYSFKICFFSDLISLLISLILVLFFLIFLSSNDANLSNPCLSIRRDEYFFTLFEIIAISHLKFKIMLKSWKSKVF